jgi:hypothetical protein
MTSEGYAPTDGHHQTATGPLASNGAAQGHSPAVCGLMAAFCFVGYFVGSGTEPVKMALMKEAVTV